MIKLEELNPHNYPLDEDQKQNIQILLERINKVREAYGKPMIVTSGVRTKADQMRINPKVKKSMHLRAAAVDIADPGRMLWHWCVDNMELLEQWGLWLESKVYTPTWVHFQIYPPGSGNRIFIP